VGWTIIYFFSYWILTKAVPVPVLGAGAIAQAEGSLAWYIDSTVLSTHTWSATGVPGFNVEGILSTLPAIASMLFDVLAGHFLRSERTERQRAAWMFVFGSVLMFAGLLLSQVLPINKIFWTSSYSVFMVGLALNVFAFCNHLIDVSRAEVLDKTVPDLQIERDHRVRDLATCFQTGKSDHTNGFRWQTGHPGDMVLRNILFLDRRSDDCFVPPYIGLHARTLPRLLVDVQIQYHPESVNRQDTAEKHDGHLNAS
jgi:hypothetical protein